MLQAHETMPKTKWHTPEWWIVTRPDGATFTMFTSKEFMAEYYGKASWPYELQPGPAWERMSVGHCAACGSASHLVDGLCYDCRPRFVDHYGPR